MLPAVLYYQIIGLWDNELCTGFIPSRFWVQSLVQSQFTCVSRGIPEKKRNTKKYENKNAREDD